MTIGSRRSRVLALIWMLAGLALLGAATVLWLDTERISVWELPLALVAFGTGILLWRQRAVLDRHGIHVVGAIGSRRTLWAGVARVELRPTSWWRPAMTIVPKGDGPARDVPTTAGLTHAQRVALVELLEGLSREHGFELRILAEDET